MKTRNYFILSAFILLTILFGCNKDIETSEKGNSVIKGELTGHSECKGLRSYSDSFTRISYTYNAKTNKLFLKHINAGFNCCPDKMSANISLNGNTIVIQETEKESLCGCLCLYDLDIRIDGVKAKKYVVKIVEPYNNLDDIEFNIDLQNNTSGTFYKLRNYYPWGM